jgi:hypothetical protein
MIGARGSEACFRFPVASFPIEGEAVFFFIFIKALFKDSFYGSWFCSFLPAVTGI